MDAWQNLVERVAELEARVAKLEGSDLPQLASDGSVAFSGDVDVAGAQYTYQWERPTNFLLAADWDEHVERLAAIAHPDRAEILRHLLTSPATVHELVDAGIVTSTGSGYHHLNALASTGWVKKSAKGLFEIRPPRIIPLLTIIAATEDH